MKLNISFVLSIKIILKSVRICDTQIARFYFKGSPITKALTCMKMYVKETDTSGYIVV